MGTPWQPLVTAASSIDLPLAQLVVDEHCSMQQPGLQGQEGVSAVVGAAPWAFRQGACKAQKHAGQKLEGRELAVRSAHQARAARGAAPAAGVDPCPGGA